MGKVRYKGMTARSKGVCYRLTEGKLSQGQHEPLVSAELWELCQKVREKRYHKKKNLLGNELFLWRGVGFEPTAEFNPSTHLAGEPNRPLWHLPKYSGQVCAIGSQLRPALRGSLLKAGG